MRSGGREFVDQAEMVFDDFEHADLFQQRLPAELIPDCQARLIVLGQMGEQRCGVTTVEVFVGRRHEKPR